MKKLFTIVLAFAMILTLVACGGKNNAGNNNNADTNTEEKVEEEVQVPETPDLQAYFDEFINSLGADNAPMMMELDAEMTEAFYPGLNTVETKQQVMQAAAMSAVPFEFALVEVANADDAAKVQEILEARKTAQVDGGAWYPETIAAWEEGEIIVNGNVVALIVAGEQQASAVEAFNALFA